jgi:hypothetical protein
MIVAIQVLPVSKENTRGYYDEGVRRIDWDYSQE